MVLGLCRRRAGWPNEDGSTHTLMEYAYIRQPRRTARYVVGKHIFPTPRFWISLAYLRSCVIGQRWQGKSSDDMMSALHEGGGFPEVRGERADCERGARRLAENSGGGFAHRDGGNAEVVGLGIVLIGHGRPAVPPRVPSLRISARHVASKLGELLSGAAAASPWTWRQRRRRRRRRRRGRRTGAGARKGAGAGECFAAGSFPLPHEGTPPPAIDTHNTARAQTSFAGHTSALCRMEVEVVGGGGGRTRRR